MKIIGNNQMVVALWSAAVLALGVGFGALIGSQQTIAGEAPPDCCTRLSIVRQGAVQSLNEMGPDADPAIRIPLEKSLGYTGNCGWDGDYYGCR